MPEANTLTALDPAHRAILLDWIASSAAAGNADTIIDLSSRPWNAGSPCAIIGVFERGKPAATWLIIRQADGWTLARCDDGRVSGPFDMLTELLAVIDGAPAD